MEAQGLEQGLRNKTPAPSELFDFGVVIPHLDYSDHLMVCLRSILMQEGSFTAHVHVQDGGSETTAGNVVSQFDEWIDPSRFRLTYTQESDSGAAQAINRGFSKVNARILTWLGADDMLMPGALEAAGSLFEQHPEIQWVTGLPHIVSESGVPAPHHGAAGFYRFPTGFSSEALKRGLHAGETNHGFIQQEGTFWSRELWEKAGGLNEDLRLAFDFDLWCRFAEHSSLMEVVAPLGAFRRRAGQASEDMSGYLAEADALRSKYLETFGRPRPGLEPTYVAFIDFASYRWKIARRSFLVVDRGLSIRAPHFALGVLRYDVVARLRANADRSAIARAALRVLTRLKKWRGF
jgi:glycosyltransferase involved in cell wall biosynthesis